MKNTTTIFFGSRAHKDSTNDHLSLDQTPDLLDIQIAAFKDFFQLETTVDKRENEGLFKVFREIFPISDSKNIFTLQFLDYTIDPPRYSIQECMDRGLTYAVPLRARLHLSCNDDEHVDFQEMTQDVFLGNVPYMTPRGTFVFNGAERVIVSQLHRSPGVFFKGSMHPNGTSIYSARIIPFKGTWMEFSTDINNVVYAYVDRKKKFPVTTLLRCIGYESDKKILELFGMADEVTTDTATLRAAIGRKLAAPVLRTWMEDFVDENTNEVFSVTRSEVILEREAVLDENGIELLQNVEALDSILLQKEHAENFFSIIYSTLSKDVATNEAEAATAIYRHIRGSEAPDEETAKVFIDKMFFSEKRYDLGDVGRYKINVKLAETKEKLGFKSDEDMDKSVLSKEDVIAIVRYLMDLVNGEAEVDDIDHLSNRRVKTVSEQLYNQFYQGLTRVARTVRDRMTVRDGEVFTPVDLINARALSGSINQFFGTSQLSQFLDETNPLSEITHKRRISALGPGGLSRERAGFEVRDVHYSHYGRLCTIETPEGPNIGLISTLCIHAKVNDRGFIQTPYRKVQNGKIGKEWHYLTADQEDENIIAQPNVEVLRVGEIREDKVIARQYGDFPELARDDINYIDVAPNQITGLSAALIPFLEHDDANRALMGSNMQRQAVPLLRPEVPIVGTGMEARAARDSRIQILAEYDGVIEYVDAREIHVRYDRGAKERLISFEDDVKKYELTKFIRTNQGTMINLRPCVQKGDKVSKGQFLTEGYAIKDGELALGRNLKVAFMPWKGYNFEDAIVISEKVVKEDWFTSVHIESFELEVRDTKVGEEELTNEIPNIGEKATNDLNEDGIINIGSVVREGSILIGKITPKGETEPTPEERLLKAIFGDRASDVRDTSLRAPAGTEGVVIDRKLFKRNDKTKLARQQQKAMVDKAEKIHLKRIDELKDLLINKLLGLIGSELSNDVCDIYGEIKIRKKEKFTEKKLRSLDYDIIHPLDWTENEELNESINSLLHNYRLKYSEEMGRYKREKYAITIGDELPLGVLKLAKVYLASKRKLKVGDKMAGRHGNKGIVAKIVREEDMPFMADGTPVDIVLNPLGVPSRMNIGQIYETILGHAGKELGVRFITPVFDGASTEDISHYIEKANLPTFGHTYLYDGETGERFDQRVTVGVIYMLKLHHMVDDKMHARSIGPYSLITQQPLGGKAQFGGQRFGEMEVWALEAYGASNILREILTIKSDDMVGRNKTYEAIVKGKNIPEPGTPESFNVLVHELRGLGIDLKFK